MRVRIGTLRLDTMASGDVRPLSQAEVRRLARSRAGLTPGRYPRADDRRRPRPERPRQPASARRIVVALDGPASSGKSSVGAAAAARLGLRFLDTGLIYRAMTAMALREGAALDDAAALVPLAARVSLGDDGTGRLTRVLLDGEDATDSIRSDAVDGAVSAVARVPEVRAALLERQRALAADGGIVVVGRDIGTVVLPGGRRSRCSSTRPSRRGPTGGSPSGAWIPTATRRRSSASSCVPATTRTAIAPWHRCAPAEDAVHVSNDGTFEQAVDSVVAAIVAAEEATA